MVEINKTHPDFLIDLNFWKNQSQRVLEYITRPDMILSIVFVDSHEILKMNRQFLNHDYITDIITFDDTLDQPDFLGEIYICLDQCKNQCSEYGHTFEEELLTLIIHGVLHLTGYDDLDELEKKKMFAEQDRIYESLINEI